jgi:hypothetical protein
MSEPGDLTDARSPLAPGTQVEVRTGFDGSWSTGFAVEEHTESGYRLRRQSDHAVLPTAFPRSAVRRERKSSMWWV